MSSLLSISLGINFVGVCVAASLGPGSASAALSRMTLPLASVIGLPSISTLAGPLGSQTLGLMTLFAAGMNIGSEGDLHLYADGVGNFQAGQTLSCVGSKIQLNSGGGKAVAAPAKLPTI